MTRPITQLKENSMKKNLPKALSAGLLMTIVLLLGTVNTSFAALKTWIGGVGVTLNWTTPGNWNGGVPVAGDDVLFNTAGVLTFTTGPAASIALNSFSVTTGTVTLPASAA